MRSSRPLLAAGILAASQLPGSALAAMCPRLQEVSTRLLEVKGRQSDADSALAQAEGDGSGVGKSRDRLLELRFQAPGEIRRRREAETADLGRRLEKMVADHNANRSALLQRRAESERRHAGDVAAATAAYQKLVSTGPATAAAEGELRASDSKVQGLVAEKERVLGELRSGFFCSECGKSRFELEQGGQTTFEAHLRNVRGHAVMRPEQLRAREEEYDRRIGQEVSRREQLRRQIEQARQKHSADLQRERQNLQSLEAQGAQVQAIGDRLRQIEGTHRTALDAHSRAVADADRKFQAEEAKRQADAEALARQIEAKQDEFESSMDAKKKGLADLAAARVELERQFDAEAQRCRSMYATEVNHETQQASQRAAAETRERQDWIAGEQQQHAARERAHRAALAAGQPPAMPPTPLAAVPAAVQESLRELARSDMQWKQSLGAGGQEFYRKLPAKVKQDIDEKVQTFTSVRGTARAVARDAWARLRSGSELAVVRNALGRGNGLAPDLAAAVESAKPELGGTLKRQLMPTIEDVGVEHMVNLRERDAGRTFDPQERVAERGFARVRLFSGNLKKHFQRLLDTYDEALDTFMIQLEEDKR